MSFNQTDPYPGSGFEDSENDLKRLLLVLWRGKALMAAITSVAAMVAVLVALSLPNIYYSNALLAPKGEAGSGGLSGLAKQYGGLANLAGLSLPTGGNSVTKALLAKEKIRSLHFYTEYLYDETLEGIMAVDVWDSASGKVVYDTNVFDESKGIWVRESAYPQKAKPSAQEAHREFLKLLSMNEDKETGLIILSVKHQSPFFAKALVMMIIDAINHDLRTNDIKEAEDSIKFLEIQRELTSLVSLDEVFSQLIEEQTKTIMLANVSKDYVFDIIDPPVVSEMKSEPRRANICILATILGGMIGIIVVLIRHYGFKIAIKR